MKNKNIRLNTRKQFDNNMNKLKLAVFNILNLLASAVLLKVKRHISTKLYC